MLFQEIFSQAKGNKEDLNQWFDRKTAKFGGKDAPLSAKWLADSTETCRVRQFVDSQFLAKITATDAPYDSTRC
jgi:hypothetical protein